MWPDLLKSNTADLPPEPLAAWRRSARKRLVDAAQQFVIRLGDSAKAAGVTLPESSMLTGGVESQRIVMTGHQPVTFHGGLCFKYLSAEQAAEQTDSIGVAVIIDVDEGDPTEFQYPAIVPEEDRRQCQLATATFCEAPAIYAFARFLPSDRLTTIVNDVEAELKQTTNDETAHRFRVAADTYVKLAAADVVPAEASVISRWTNEIGNRLLELPLSAICAFPEAVDLTTQIMKKADEFAATYNRELETFRSDHDIRNTANPFPNLQSIDDGQEMPFWVLNSVQQTRHRLIVRTNCENINLIADGEVLLTAVPDALRAAVDDLAVRGIQLVPRGAMVSTFLRLLFADLFVHGLGGEHYEPFTDRFIESWWKVSPAPFTVASASEYLFAEQRDELHRLQGVESQLRDLRYNPQRHFDSGVFSEELEKRLQELVEQKQSAIASMKTAHADGKSAKDIGHQIQQISDQIRATVDEAFHDDLTALESITDNTQQAFECRTYPWFLFA